MPSSRPPAVLITNPSAGRLGDSERARVIDALHEVFRLDALSTTARDAAIGMAAEAASAGVKLVIAFGGDGVVNEVANGLAGTPSALGVIPGGTMNVFGRALGVPLDPIDAIEHLRRSLDRPPRVVPLGRMDGRYFTFSAGCGFDAEAAARVERDIPAKRRFGELFFYWSAFRVLAGSYRHRRPYMTLRGPFGEVEVSMAIASNAGPYAYLAGRAVNIAPQVSLEGRIDVFALKTMRIEALPSYAWRVLVSGDFVDHRDVFYMPNIDRFELHSDESFVRHVDGEPLEPATATTFSAVPDILRVRA